MAQLSFGVPRNLPATDPNRQELNQSSDAGAAAEGNASVASPVRLNHTPVGHRCSTANVTRTASPTISQSFLMGWVSDRRRLVTVE